jgi:hypothetical protein
VLSSLATSGLASAGVAVVLPASSGHPGCSTPGHIGKMFTCPGSLVLDKITSLGAFCSTWVSPQTCCLGSDVVIPPAPGLCSETGRTLDRMGILAVFVCAWVWSTAWRLDAKSTASRAQRETSGRELADAVLLGACRSPRWSEGAQLRW